MNAWMHRLPPGAARRFTAGEVAEALQVPYDVVLGWCQREMLRARRVWQDWRRNPRQFRYEVKRRAVERALNDPRVLADVWKHRAMALNTRAGEEEVPRPSPLLSQSAIPSRGSDRQGPDGGDHNL